MLKIFRRWFRAQTPTERIYMHEPPAVRRRKIRPWTGLDSGTAKDILYHLKFGPMTRRQLDEVLDVTTAGLHLPKLVRAGKIQVIPGTWPFRYELTELRESVDAVARTDGVVTS